MNSKTKFLFIFTFFLMFFLGLFLGSKFDRIVTQLYTFEDFNDIKSKQDSNFKNPESESTEFLKQNSNLDITTLIKGELIDISLSRAEVIEKLKDYKLLLKTARAVPYIDQKTGQVIGFKVTYIEAGSLFNKLKIQSRDIFRSVNGKPLNSVNNALNAFAEIKESKSYMDDTYLILDRDGRELTLKYNLTD